jgi:cobalamin transport system substrate-binding protein
MTSGLRMRRTVSIIIFLLIACAASISDAAPERIVSLKPNITEIVYALGLGNKLVGRTKYCDWPTSVKKVTIVADYTRPFVERIIAINPDVVLASKENTIRRPMDKLSSMKIRIELFDFSSLPATIKSIREIADLLGEHECGVKLTEDIQRKISSMKRRWANKTTKSVALVVGLRPLIIAGKGSYLEEMLAIINTRNAVKKPGIKYPRIDLEGLIAIDPEAIIDLSMGSENNSRGGSRPWSNIPALRAVSGNHVIPFDMGSLRPSPRLPDALDRLAELIHAE